MRCPCTDIMEPTYTSFHAKQSHPANSFALAVPVNRAIQNSEFRDQPPQESHDAAPLLSPHLPFPHARTASREWVKLAVSLSRPYPHPTARHAPTNHPTAPGERPRARRPEPLCIYGSHRVRGAAHVSQLAPLRSPFSLLHPPVSGELPSLPLSLCCAQCASRGLRSTALLESECVGWGVLILVWGFWRSLGLGMDLLPSVCSEDSIWPFSPIYFLSLLGGGFGLDCARHLRLDFVSLCLVHSCFGVDSRLPLVFRGVIWLRFLWNFFDFIPLTLDLVGFVWFPRINFPSSGVSTRFSCTSTVSQLVRSMLCYFPH